MKATLKVLLFNSETMEKKFQDYEIDVEKGTTVLRALYKIARDFPNAPAFRRYQCNRGQCFSCLMTINGKNRRACMSAVEQEMVLEPLRGYPVVRDLVVDFGRKQSVGLKQLFIEHRGGTLNTAKVNAKQVDRNQVSGLDFNQENCTNCGLCADACPVNAKECLEDVRGNRLNQGEVCLRLVEGGVDMSGACPQCALSPCIDSCPTSAIKKENGIVYIVETLCNGCFSCLRACPSEEIYMNMGRGIAVKCDLCKGEPKCAAACPNEALTYK